MVAMVVFFGIVLYVLNSLNASVSGYSTDFLSETMESKANQIGELIVLNKGNWSASGGLVLAGVAEDWPVLNRTKIFWLNVSCNNDYPGFLSNLGLSSRNGLKVVINETKPDGTVSSLADCPAGRLVNVKRAEAKRYALAPDVSSPNIMNVAGVFVYVW